MIHVIGDDPDGESQLDKLKSALGNEDIQQLNITVLDAQQLAIDDLIGASEAMPFLADRRIVMVRGLLARLEPRKQAVAGGSSLASKPSDLASDDKEAPGRVKSADMVRRLSEYLARIPETTDLVFVERQSITKQNALYKGLTQAKAQFGRIGALEGGELATWIERRTKMKGGKLANGVSTLLASLGPQDRRRLDGELEQLVTYAGDQPIDKAAVHLFVSASRDLSIFRACDALASGEHASALAMLRQLIADGESPLYVLSMVVRQFRLLIAVKDLQARGLSVAAISTALHQQPFAVERLLRQLRRYRSNGHLDRVYGRLLEADTASKTGGMDVLVSLELLATELRERHKIARN